MADAGTLLQRGIGRWLVLSMLPCLLSVSRLPAAAQDQAQTLDMSELVLESGERTFAFQVELADEPRERQVGLMHRKEMAPDHGMLFDFERSQPVAMWTRNTFIPLDMLFIDEGGEIVNIAHDTVPHSEEVLQSAGPVRFVLEVVAGRSRLLGIGPGVMVRHEAIGNMPATDQVNG